MKVQDMAQNLYSDTRGQSERPVTFTEAVIDGLAAGGGLYVPERIPELSLDEIGALAELPYAQRAARIYRAFDVDLPAETVEALMAQAYGDNFDDERICPITSLSADTHVLELWHGPTSAFKDMALQCLPRLFSASAAQLREQGKLDHDFLILVATSGDTGKAALEGFRDVDGVSIGVMYPDGGVSDIQFKQMATQRGRNVQVWGVRGNFDDCQTGAKNVFGDEAFAKKLQDEHRIALSSANSINWGRLMPQIVYYVSAYAQLAADGKLNLGDELDVCVPTGNFGNILAAYYAKRMGVPLGMLYCASNENRVLTDFINTGTYDISERPFVLTPSPSMDILVSSNLERQLFELTGEPPGTRRRRHSRLDGRPARAAPLPRGRRDLRPRAGAVRVGLHRQRHVPGHHQARVRAARLPVGPAHGRGLPDRREPSGREPRAHREHGALGQVRRQRVPRAARHRAWRAAARRRGRAVGLQAERADRARDGRRRHPPRPG